MPTGRTDSGPLPDYPSPISSSRLRAEMVEMRRQFKYLELRAAHNGFIVRFNGDEHVFLSIESAQEFITEKIKED